jgi:hypothetical protein
MERINSAAFADVRFGNVQQQPYVPNRTPPMKKEPP